MNNEYLDLYHTSPEDIEDINQEGRYGSHLFFSKQPYYTTMHEKPSLYKHRINKKEIMNVKDIENAPKEKIDKFLNILKKRTGLNDEEALNILSENENIHNFKNKIEDLLGYNQFLSKNERERLENILKKLETQDIGELDWDIQGIIGKIAKNLGFRGVQVSDEQGTSFMIDMIDRLHELEKQEK